MPHISGPWNDRGDTVIVADDGKRICYICDCRDGSTTQQEARNNARLIAASPELLAAAIDAVETFEAGGMPGGPIMRLKAAIVLARGKPIPDVK